MNEDKTIHSHEGTQQRSGSIQHPTSLPLTNRAS